MPDPAFLPAAETAALLRIGRNVCYELIAEGRIPSAKLRRRIIVPRDQLLAQMAVESEGSIGAEKPVNSARH